MCSARGCRGNVSTYLHVRVGEATSRQVVRVHSNRLLLSSHVLIFVKCQWIHGTLIIQTPGTEDRGTKGWQGRTSDMHPFSFILTLQMLFLSSIRSYIKTSPLWLWRPSNLQSNRNKPTNMKPEIPFLDPQTQNYLDAVMVFNSTQMKVHIYISPK